MANIIYDIIDMWHSSIRCDDLFSLDQTHTDATDASNTDIKSSTQSRQSHTLYS